MSDPFPDGTLSATPKDATCPHSDASPFIAPSLWDASVAAEVSAEGPAAAVPVPTASAGPQTTVSHSCSPTRGHPWVEDPGRGSVEGIPAGRALLLALRKAGVLVRQCARNGWVVSISAESEAARCANAEHAELLKSWVGLHSALSDAGLVAVRQQGGAWQLSGAAGKAESSRLGRGAMQRVQVLATAVSASCTRAIAALQPDEGASEGSPLPAQSQQHVSLELASGRFELSDELEQPVWHEQGALMHHAHCPPETVAAAAAIGPNEGTSASTKQRSLREPSLYAYLTGHTDVSAQPSALAGAEPPCGHDTSPACSSEAHEDLMRKLRAAEADRDRALKLAAFLKKAEDAATQREEATLELLQEEIRERQELEARLNKLQSTSALFS